MNLKTVVIDNQVKQKIFQLLFSVDFAFSFEYAFEDNGKLNGISILTGLIKAEISLFLLQAITGGVPLV